MATFGARVTSRCFITSVGGLESSLTQHLLCRAARKPGSSKVISRPTMLIYLFVCFFFSCQGTVITFFQGHQDEGYTLCVSKHRKVSGSARDILFGPDYILQSWSCRGGGFLNNYLRHTHTFWLGGKGLYVCAGNHWPCHSCSPEFSLCFLQKPLHSQTHPSCAY